MREADWTLNPVTERELSQIRQGRRNLRRWGWALTIVAGGGCPLSCLWPLFAFAEHGGIRSESLGFLALVAAAFLCPAYLNAKSVARRRQLEHQARLAKDYAEAPGWFVKLQIFQGAAPTGIDRGIVWFEDGRLYFTGERTSFGLMADQTSGEMRWNGTGAKHASHLNLPLRIRSRAGPVSLGFDVLRESYSVQGDWTVGALGDAMRRWQSAPRDQGEDEGQGPPLALGPDAPSTLGLFGFAVAISTVWTVFVSGLLAAALYSHWGFVPLLLMGLPLLTFWPDVWQPRHLWRAWRDRRRLEKTR